MEEAAAPASSSAVRLTEGAVGAAWVGGEGLAGAEASEVAFAEFVLDSALVGAVQDAVTEGLLDGGGGTGGRVDGSMRAAGQMAVRYQQ